MNQLTKIEYTEVSESWKLIGKESGKREYEIDELRI